MEVYFNELSLYMGKQIQYEVLDRLRILYLNLREEQINICRISSNDYVELLEQIKRMHGFKTEFLDFVYSFFAVPYESEAVDEKQEQFLESEWQYKGKECVGLALAYIMDSMSVSIGDSEWNRCILQIMKDDSQVEVRNLYDEKTFCNHLDWIQNLKPIELITSDLLPREKPCHLRDDHGKDTLQLFCDKILRNKYVCGVINSIPFNPQQRSFIRAIEPNGIVEIVLCWTDEGYGIAVQTTGRNEKETKEIARILTEEYS